MGTNMMLQFTTDRLNMSNKSAVINEIYIEIIKLLDVTEIVGVQLVPKHWPHHVDILCANSKAKNILLEKGLTIQDTNLELSEPGLGKVKVIIDDAPLDLSNGILRETLNGYGKVLDIHNEYIHVDGTRLPWWNGTRIAHMCDMKTEIPPTMKLHVGQKHVKIKLWHHGQTLIECRWCREHIVKEEHDCPKRPQKRCFNCGSSAHLRGDCEVGKQCFKCGDESHIARNCPHGTAITTAKDVSEKDEGQNLPPEKNNTNYPPLPTSPDVQDLGSPCLDSPETRDFSLEAPEHHSNPSVKCLLLGSSNCRNLEIPGDDDLRIQTGSHVTGGLKIKDVTKKLGNMSSDELKNAQAVILHVGSTDFPVRSEDDFNNHYMQYVENLSEISTSCPKATILISSILPHKGKPESRTNKQIRLFNQKLIELAETETNLIYVDSYSCLTDGDQVLTSLYSDNDADKIHLNATGKARVAEGFRSVLKEVVYRGKLENEWQIAVRTTQH